MKTIEIRKAEWSSFARSFSRLHDGWMFSLEILDPNLGAQAELANRPFRGLSYEKRDGDETLLILSGDRRGNHLCHPVPDPKRLWLEQTDQGADQALAIESTDGKKTLVKFRTTILPEMLDALVE